MSQYWIVGEDADEGPFTLDEIKAKWRSGEVVPGAEYRDDTGHSGLVSELRFRKDEKIATDDESQSIEFTPTEIFKRYTQMKSPTTAALLAIALPFIGAYYGSMTAVFIPPICAAVVVGLLIGISKAMVAVMPFLFAIAYVISVIWSVNAVTEHNRQMSGRDKRNT